MTHGNLMASLWALVYTCEIWAALGLSIEAFGTGSAASLTPRSPGLSMPTRKTYSGKGHGLANRRYLSHKGNTNFIGLGPSR